MQRTPRSRAVLVLLAAGALLAGCGDDATDASSGASGPAVVTMERSRFEPPELTVEAGSEVTFRNLDAAAHTVTSAEGATRTFDSGDLGQDAEYAVQLDEPGTYEYFCEIHPTMRGTVVVA